MLKEHYNEKLAIKVSVWSIIINFLLSAFKMFAGIIGCSFAMISDSIHSLSDVLSTFVVIIGIKISNKQPDNKHEYGHERFECVASIILAILIAVVGIGIGYSAFDKLINGTYVNFAIPTTIALIASVVSIIVKEIMYWVTIIASKKTKSVSLKADAWHHRSDALSSVGSLIGIVGAMLGFPILDIVAGMIICLFIIKVAVDIFIDSIRKMTDESCDKNIEDKICEMANNVQGVISVKNIKTRLFGSKIYVDLVVCCDPNLTLSYSNKIAEEVHNNIEDNLENIKHVSVIVNPCNDNKIYKNW